MSSVFVELGGRFVVDQADASQLFPGSFMPIARTSAAPRYLAPPFHVGGVANQPSRTAPAISVIATVTVAGNTIASTVTPGRLG